MSKYFDWRIDSDKAAKSLLWLREKDDGTISVVLEYGGVWQWDKQTWNAVDRVEPNAIANSQQIVTDTCLGEAAIKAWRANGSPNKQAITPTKQYIADIFMAPASVMKHLEHGDAHCGNVDFLVEMGVEEAE